MVLNRPPYDSTDTLMALHDEIFGSDEVALARSLIGACESKVYQEDLKTKLVQCISQAYQPLTLDDPSASLNSFLCRLH